MLRVPPVARRTDETRRRCRSLPRQQGHRDHDRGSEEALQTHVIRKVKATDDVGLLIRPIPLDSETVVVSYGDSSWANAQNYKSQEGIAIVLTTREALEGLDRCVLLDWKTTRTPRVVRSTIAGAAYAADDAINRAYYTNCVMTEIISGEPVVKTGPKLLHVHATDCRSLFDAVISANPSTEEKRVLMAVRAIQEALDPKWFRWVPTGLMVADVLTKDSDALRWAFLPWLREPTCRLREVRQKDAKV